MPNLDHFKKQAKMFLRWHRQGYYPVAAQIRRDLPRFTGLSDPQILAADFKLSDAQELVARRAGFENWTALKKRIETISAGPPETTTPVLLAAEPQLFVSDIVAACDFYRDLLGFQVAFVYGEPPFYAQVFRDGARLNLRHADRPAFDRDFLASEPDVLSATITLEDAKPLFLEYQAAGVPFHQSLRSEPWGARTFIVADPDGNLIAFAGSGKAPS